MFTAGSLGSYEQHGAGAGVWIHAGHKVYILWLVAEQKLAPI